MAHYFPVSVVIVRLFFVTLEHHTADPKTGRFPTAHSLSLHPTDKHSHTCLFLASWTLGPRVILASFEHMDFRVVAGNVAYCSLGGLVLNLLLILCMGENQSILFLLDREACV